MNSSQKWFILDLRLALAVYIGFIQFFIYIPNSQGQSSDPGSFQQQMIQSRIEREVQEKKGTVASPKITENKVRVKLEDGEQVDGTAVAVNNGSNSPSYIFLEADMFDKIANTVPASKTGHPKNMTLTEVIRIADAIKERNLGPIDQHNKESFDQLKHEAGIYKEYKQEMARFEDSVIRSKMLKFAEGVQFENISKEAILNERQVLANKKLATVVHEANVRFPKDTAMFFVLIGATIAIELMFKNGGDPLAMQHHFESLTDPIANLAFYSFILANGLSLHYLKLGASKKLIDMNHRVLFSHLPMLSMPFASLVSNVVSDTAMTIQACTDELTDPKKAAKKKKEDDLIYSACDEALRQWTFENKANQYLPQLISLSVSNAPFLALGYASQNISKKLQVYKFMGAETIITRVGGKILMTSLKFLLSPVPAIALDMLITNPLATRAWSTASDDIRIDNAKERIFENANNCHWELQAGGKVPATMPKACEKLKEDALILRDRSQSWRATINSDFETGFASWSTLMTKFNNQFNAAQGFYSYVFNLIMDYNFSKTICDTFKVLKHCEYMDSVFGMETFFLTKKYPLVGAKVDPKVFNSSAKGDTPEEYAVKLKNAFSDFAGNPKFLIRQLENIRVQANNFLKNRSLTLNTSMEKMIFEIISIKLRSEKPLEIVTGIEELNASFKERSYRENVSSEFKNLHRGLIQGIGEIKPIMNNGEGFLWARSYHSQFDDARTTEEYPILPRKRYNFPTTAHYLLHEMLCGDGKGDFSQLMDFGREVGKVGHSYTPPRLIKDRDKIAGYCFRSIEKIDYRWLFDDRLNSSLSYNGRPTNPTLYLLKNYDFNLFERMNEYGELYGETQSDGTFKPKKHEAYFSDWWTAANKEMMDKFLGEAQEDWMRIYTELILSFKNRGYVQDPSQRITIIKKAKGAMSDNVIKSTLDAISEFTLGTASEYKTQPKNSLEVIIGETNIYFDLLKKLNLNDNTKKSLRRMDAIIDYMHAQNQAIEFLSKIFDTTYARTDRQIEVATQRLPDSETVTKHQEALGTAMSQLKTYFMYGENEPIIKSVNTDIIYALEASNTDLNKYLMSAFIVGFKDKEALRKLKEMSKKMQQIMNLNSQGQGVRKSGNQQQQ